METHIFTHMSRVVGHGAKLRGSAPSAPSCCPSGEQILPCSLPTADLVNHLWWRGNLGRCARGTQRQRGLVYFSAQDGQT